MTNRETVVARARSARSPLSLNLALLLLGMDRPGRLTARPAPREAEVEAVRSALARPARVVTVTRDRRDLNQWRRRARRLGRHRRAS